MNRVSVSERKNSRRSGKRFSSAACNLAIIRERKIVVLVLSQPIQTGSQPIHADGVSGQGLVAQRFYAILHKLTRLHGVVRGFLPKFPMRERCDRVFRRQGANRSLAVVQPRPVFLR